MKSSLDGESGGIRSPRSRPSPTSWNLLHSQSDFSCHNLQSPGPTVWGLTACLRCPAAAPADVLHPRWAFSLPSSTQARILSFFFFFFSVAEMDRHISVSFLRNRYNFLVPPPVKSWLLNGLEFRRCASTRYPPRPPVLFLGVWMVPNPFTAFWLTFSTQ